MKRYKLKNLKEVKRNNKSFREMKNLFTKVLKQEQKNAIHIWKQV